MGCLTALIGGCTTEHCLYLKTKPVFFLLQGTSEDLKVGTGVAYTLLQGFWQHSVNISLQRLKMQNISIASTTLATILNSLTWTLLLHTLESPRKTASPDNKASTSPSKLVLKSIALTGPNTARFVFNKSQQIWAGTLASSISAIFPSRHPLIWNLWHSVVKAPNLMQILLAARPQCALRKPGISVGKQATGMHS